MKVDYIFENIILNILFFFLMFYLVINYLLSNFNLVVNVISGYKIVK